jgi:hypothetical protein
MKDSGATEITKRLFGELHCWAASGSSSSSSSSSQPHELWQHIAAVAAAVRPRRRSFRGCRRQHFQLLGGPEQLHSVTTAAAVAAAAGEAISSSRICRTDWGQPAGSVGSCFSGDVLLLLLLLLLFLACSLPGSHCSCHCWDHSAS